MTRLREVSYTIDHPTFCDVVHKEFCRTFGRNPAAVPVSISRILGEDSKALFQLQAMSETEMLANDGIVKIAEELKVGRLHSLPGC